MQYDDVISNAIWGRHIENRLLAISLRFIVRLTQNLIGRSRIIIRRRPLDQHSSFQKFMMADGHLLKMVLSLYLSGESSDFNEIGVQMQILVPKYQNFADSKWRTIFLSISQLFIIRLTWSLVWRSRITLTQVTWPKYRTDFLFVSEYMSA